MAQIQVLDFEIANLIAAGEVVERPSSVVKELIENSIDAGATRIVAEIKRGGVAVIRVTDDGCGIARDDLPVSLKRHATSKIRTKEDLDGIGTLGFRGEALAAIAAVSRITMITKRPEDAQASMLTAEGGEVMELSEVGAADGTTVVVEDLFFNVPARRKFLKKDATEAMNVTALVERVALSRPDISIQLVIDGEERFRTPGDGVAENTVYAVLGKDFASKMLPVDAEVNRIRVHGYIGRSDNVRRNRNLENVFINGRYVKSMTVCAALERAFTSYIAPECFPTCVLFVEMHPSVVDVNVHPSKLEVKFSDERQVFEAVYYTVREKLESSEYRPDMTLAKKPYTPTFAPTEGKEQLRMAEPSSPKTGGTLSYAELFPKTQGRDDASHALAHSSATPTKNTNNSLHNTSPKPSVPLSERGSAPSAYASAAPRIGSGAGHLPTVPNEQLSPRESLALLDALEKRASHPTASDAHTTDAPAYRYVGEAFDCYVMIEHEGDLLIIDKHAAHERVLFEDLKREQLRDSRVCSQELLLPLDVTLNAEAAEAVRSQAEELHTIGFTFTVEGTTAALTAIPSLLALSDAQGLFTEMADELVEGRGNPSLTEASRRERLLYQIACKGAIKGGRSYDRTVIDWLIGKVLALPDITVCPHGRPIAYRLTKRELDRQFDRIK